MVVFDVMKGDVAETIMDELSSSKVSFSAQISLYTYQDSLSADCIHSNHSTIFTAASIGLSCTTSVAFHL